MSVQVRLVVPRTPVAPHVLELPANTPHPYPLLDMPLDAQQLLVVKDLLGSLVGQSGSYVRLSGGDFKVARHMDILLKEFAKRISRCGKWYRAVVAYADTHNTPEQGQTAQALCAYIREFVDTTYHPCVVRLEQRFRQERPPLSLIQMEQALTGQVTTPLGHLYELVQALDAEDARRATLRQQNQDDLAFDLLVALIKQDIRDAQLADIVTDPGTGPVAGGDILGAIQELGERYRGDTELVQFLSHCLEHVGSSYVAMLNAWLATGVAHDPHHEFVVRTVDPRITTINSARYWDARFVVRPGGARQLATRDVQRQVLRTGKFLNVMRACGVDVEASAEPVYPVSRLLLLRGHDAELKLHLSRMYERLSRMMHRLLWDGYDMGALLEWMRGLFFCSGGMLPRYDAFVAACMGELRRPRLAASSTRIRKAFQGAFQGEMLTGMPRVMMAATEMKLADLYFPHLLDILATPSVDVDEALKLGMLLRGLLQRLLGTGGSSGAQHDSPTFMCVELVVQVPFPLNLVLTDDVLALLQLIHRHMFIIKTVQAMHGDGWRQMQQQRVGSRRGAAAGARWTVRLRALHHQVAQVLAHYEGYLAEVAAAGWREVARGPADGVGEWQAALQRTLNTVMKSLFLVNRELVELAHGMVRLVVQLNQLVRVVLKDGEARERECREYLELLWTSWHDTVLNFVQGLLYLSEHDSSEFGRLVQALG